MTNAVQGLAINEMLERKLKERAEERVQHKLKFMFNKVPVYLLSKESREALAAIEQEVREKILPEELADEIDSFIGAVYSRAKGE